MLCQIMHVFFSISQSLYNILIFILYNIVAKAVYLQLKSAKFAAIFLQAGKEFWSEECGYNEESQMF